MRKFKLIIILIIILLIICSIVFIYKIFTLTKFIYVNNKGGNAEIIVIDPQKTKTVKIVLDKDLKIESARNLGEYKISSLWALGEKEKYQGKLLTESILKNFALPLYLWQDGKSSNLNIFQKIKIFFSNKSILEDDFKIISKKDVPNSILINFVDPEIVDKMPKVKIEDLTGEAQKAETVSKVLEVLGFKTVDYSKGYDSNLDCEVISSNKQYAETVAKVFGCNILTNQDISLDLKIRIGAKFADRF